MPFLMGFSNKGTDLSGDSGEVRTAPYLFVKDNLDQGRSRGGIFDKDGGLLGLFGRHFWFFKGYGTITEF